MLPQPAVTREARMPRPLRLHIPGGFYHVTLRGNHRQSIFFTHADRDLFNEITCMRTV